MLRRLFADYGLRFDTDFEVKDKNTLLVRNPETGQMNSAPLNDERMRSSLAPYLADVLEQGFDSGPVFVKRLEREKKAPEETSCAAPPKWPTNPGTKRTFDGPCRPRAG